MTDGPDAGGVVPDTKDWTWVLERPCPECGFSAAPGTGPQVAHRLRVDVLAWEQLLAELAAGVEHHLHDVRR